MFCLQPDSVSTFATGFFYVSPGVMVEVNGVRSLPFTLSQSIRHDCLLLSMLYVFALEPFQRKLRKNLALRSLTLSSATMTARYTAYTDVVSVFVMSSTGWRRLAKKSEGMRLWWGPKLTGESAGLWLGSVNGCTLLSPFIGWTTRARYSVFGSVPISNWIKIGRR